jgi:hypothetical protein
MKDFIMNYALVITAIISLVGVSFAAIINYRSNIRINKIKLEHEEKKLKREFLQESFDCLRASLQEMTEININFIDNGFHINLSMATEHLIKIEGIYDRVTPFLTKEETACLEKANKKVYDFTSQEKKMFEQVTIFQRDLREYIKDEILALSNKLREFSL